MMMEISGEAQMRLLEAEREGAGLRKAEAEPITNFAASISFVTVT
jgi:hypothetical protein